MTNIFQTNLEKWSQTDPRRALLLPYLHPKKKPAEPRSASGWLKKLDLKEADVLFVYGIAAGEYYQALKTWLSEDSKHVLIFLEDDLEAIYHLFHTKCGSDLLKNKQTRLFYFEHVEEVKDILLMLAWEFLMKKLVVAAIPQYAKKETADLLLHRIIHDATMHNSIVEEYLKYGAGFYKNFYPNVLSMPGAALGTNLFGKFKKVPAIICGAGPSLAKHLPVLESLKDRALIFAGGSSLNALSAAGIKPHFGAGIDPNPTQLDRISSSKSTNLPFFFRNRMNHQALKMIQGPRLYIPGSGGYDTAEWFETELGIERDEILDEGYNVVNFCVEIARAMGCSPIIFVGVDLAFTGMQSYVSGVIEHNRVKKNEILKGSDFDLIALKKKDIHGKPVYTLWKWISESEWIAQYAKDHPKTALINATEGGLGFPDVPNQSLKSVVKKHLTRKFNLEGRIRRSVVPMPQITRGKTLKLLNTIETSLQTCEKYLRILLEEVEAMRMKIEKLEVVDPNFNFLSGRAALFEMDLAEEVAYKYVLEVFNEVFARITYHEMQQLKQSAVPEKTKKLGQLAANAKRLTFLVQVAAVQQELIRISKLTP